MTVPTSDAYSALPGRSTRSLFGTSHPEQHRQSREVAPELDPAPSVSSTDHLFRAPQVLSPRESTAFASVDTALAPSTPFSSVQLPLQAEYASSAPNAFPHHHHQSQWVLRDAPVLVPCNFVGPSLPTSLQTSAVIGPPSASRDDAFGASSSFQTILGSTSAWSSGTSSTEGRAVSATLCSPWGDTFSQHKSSEESATIKTSQAFLPTPTALPENSDPACSATGDRRPLTGNSSTSTSTLALGPIIDVHQSPRVFAYGSHGPGQSKPSAAEQMPRTRRSSDGDELRHDGPSGSGSAGRRDAEEEGIGEAKEPQRRQNTSCDACRSRKVACKKLKGESKCQHCKSKGIECTTVYIQLATNGPKRPTKRLRGSTIVTASSAGSGNGGGGGGSGADGTTALGDDLPLPVVRFCLLRDNEYDPGIGVPITRSNARDGRSLPPSLAGRRLSPTTAAESRLAVTQAREDLCNDLVDTYFKLVHIRYPVLDADAFLQKYRDGNPPDVLLAVILAWGAKYSESPIIVADRKETAAQLTPRQQQRRAAAAHAEGKDAVMARSRPVRDVSIPPEPHGLRDFLTAPRDVVNADSARSAASKVGRSRIAEDLIVKAQEVLDRNKAHRIATMDNAKACLIIQALFWQRGIDDVRKAQVQGLSGSEEVVRPTRRGLYNCNGAWVVSGLTHLIELRVHLQETVSRIDDISVRSQATMTWWLACMMDAHMSAMFRRKPHLSIEDYDVEPPFAAQNAENYGPHPLSAQIEQQKWLSAATDQVEMMREVYFSLWTPRVAKEGVSVARLQGLMGHAERWRSRHLGAVGAPSPSWPTYWSFATAVTAAASDVNYHIVWIFMFQAIEEFGIAELRKAEPPQEDGAFKRPLLPRRKENGSSEVVEAQTLKERIYDEALNAATRTAAVTQVLQENGYLRLEAGIMKVAMSEAGYCLAHFKRPEILSIISGLRQYGQAFEECYDQADSLQLLAATYMENVESDLAPSSHEDAQSGTTASSSRDSEPHHNYANAGLPSWGHDRDASDPGSADWAPSLTTPIGVASEQQYHSRVQAIQARQQEWPKSDGYMQGEAYSGSDLRSHPGHHHHAPYHSLHRPHEPPQQHSHQIASEHTTHRPQAQPHQARLPSDDGMAPTEPPTYMRGYQRTNVYPSSYV